MIYAFRNPVPVFGQAHKCGGIKLINVPGNLNTIIHCMGIYHTRFSRYAVRYMVLSENSMKYRFYCQSCQENYSFEQPHFLTDRSVGRRLFCFTLFITLLLCAIIIVRRRLVLFCILLSWLCYIVHEEGLSCFYCNCQGYDVIYIYIREKAGLVLYSCCQGYDMIYIREKTGLVLSSCCHGCVI